MRTALRLTALLIFGACLSAQSQPVGTMSDLMVKIIYPASDAIFYITTRTPATEAEWTELQGKALAVAESANLLMMPGRARDQDRWMSDARLMLDAGRTAYRAARAKDVAGLEAVNDALYNSCTSCHQHYRPNYGRRPPAGGSTEGTAAPAPPALPAPAASPAPPAPPAPPALEGRWKLLAAEDLRADGSVARLPWGAHPVGSIVVDRGACYLQIMSSDTPSLTSASPAGDQMKAALLSSYIAYSGPCAIDAAAGSVTLKVEAAWRPDYVGTEQKRFFRFENGKLLFGPAPNSVRSGNEQLTRRLTLERVP
jgi:lipocalin-like protein